MRPRACGCGSERIAGARAVRPRAAPDSREDRTRNAHRATTRHHFGSGRERARDVAEAAGGGDGLASPSRVGPRRGGRARVHEPGRRVPAAARRRFRVCRIRRRRRRSAPVGRGRRRQDAHRRVRRGLPSGRRASARTGARVRRAVLPRRPRPRRRRLAAARPRGDDLAVRHAAPGARRRNGAGAVGGRGGGAPRGGHRRGPARPPAAAAGRAAAGGRLVRPGVPRVAERRADLLRQRRRRPDPARRGRLPVPDGGRRRRRHPHGRPAEARHDAVGRPLRGARPPAAGRDRHPRRPVQLAAVHPSGGFPPRRRAAARRAALDGRRRRRRFRQRLGRPGGGRRPRPHRLGLRLLRRAARLGGRRRRERPHPQHRQRRLPERVRRAAAVRPGGHRRARLRPDRTGNGRDPDLVARRRHPRADAQRDVPCRPPAYRHGLRPRPDRHPRAAELPRRPPDLDLRHRPVPRLRPGERDGGSATGPVPGRPVRAGLEPGRRGQRSPLRRLRDRGRVLSRRGGRAGRLPHGPDPLARGPRVA